MSRATTLGSIFILFLAVLGYYFFGWERPAAKGATVMIGGHTFEVEVADTPATRSKGLSGRPAPKEDEGMLFAFDDLDRHGFWMKDMQFPIDIVWIRDGQVVGVSENLKPPAGGSIFELPIYYPPEPIDMVLEIMGGLAGRYGFKTGDPVVTSERR